MKTRRTVLLFVLFTVLFGTLCAAALLSTGATGMSFDGLAEYNTGSVDMPLPLTYEATVRLPEELDGAGGVIFGNNTDDGAACFNFGIHTNGSPRLFIIDGGAVKYDVIFDKVNIANGEKTHLAITLDRTAKAYTCYVNGEIAQTVSASVPQDLTLTSAFALGGDNLAANDQYFKGELFALALYSDLRDASEIALDATGSETCADGLIAAYGPLNSENEGKNITAMGDEKYNITYTCEWVKDVPLPDDFAYSFAVIGDIQSMTYYYPDKLVEQFEWIRDNKDEKKIAFSVGLGDITEKNTENEYLKVIEAYDKIDGLIPFSIIRGNHDRTSDNSTAMYDTYITQERYGDEITGSLDDTMHNTYRIIQIGKVKYMFMNLDLVLSDEAIDWANEIIAAHPECHVIVSTHAYKNMSGTYLALATQGKFGVQNDSVVLWDRLLSQHENIVMILYGHSPKDKIYRNQREGVNGNIVTEMLINPSETDKIYGGGGFVAMFYFSEDGEQLDVQYYSTIKKAFYRSDNLFTLELDTPGAVEFSSVMMNVGSDESERNLTWYTQYDTVGDVRYGKSDGGSLPLNYSVVKATSSKAVKDGYYSYKATMTGLEPNSTYVYQLAVGDVLSECYTFKTYGMGDDFSFAFITDPQVKKSSHATLWDDTLNKIKNLFEGVSIVVSGGDQTSEPSSEDNFDWFISDHLSSLAIATTVGPPHDNSQLYKDHYNLPNLSTKYGVSTPSSDYFYTYNNVLFMHLNVENNDYDGHIRFMENAIADNPDCTWRVVLLHFSFFSGGNHSTDGSVTAFRTQLAGKFSEFGVDAVLSGHDHVYTRSQMMKDGYTLSGDTVTDGTVTDPTGTLYICGTSSTGSGWYDVEHHDDDAYIAKSVDTERKSVVIFNVSEDSLTLNSYFVDGSTPELFDTFTIYKSERTARLNGDTDALEIKSGTDYIPLLNAYAYSRATVKVVGGYWSVSTDGGASYASLGIASDDTLHVLKINDSTGYWELSSDGGASFESVGINARTYTVKYVAIQGSEFGDATDISGITARRFTAESPDGPELWMTKGSLKIGRLYTWSWEYYVEGGDGTPVSSFEYGESYVAYPVASESPIADTIYIDSVSNPSEYTYTWLEAWDIVTSCPREKLTLALKSDITLTADDAIALVVPVNLTLDLAGNRLDTSALTSVIKFAVGSNGSSFKVVTSEEGGTLAAGINNLIELGSNQGSTVSIQYGSEDTKPLTVESIGYLVYSNGNFKYTSTLNLAIYGGSYTVAKGVVYVSNVSSGASYNIYKLTLKDATFGFSGGDSAIVRSRGAGYCANSASFINAEGCVFKDTYKANSTSSRFIIREDNWYGTASFTDCDFIGMSVGTDVGGAALANCGTITVGKGCTFTNSKTSFSASSPLSFFSEKVVTAGGCVIARTDALGSAEVILLSDAAEITWSNPVGYKEYWKKGATPAYLGDTTFTSGDKTYSLVLTEQPAAANESKTYSFVSAEGYLYRYDEARSVWQISTDGGSTYTDITESGDTPEPEPPSGCTVTIDGVSTFYTADTDFATVIASFNTTANAGKEVSVVLSADMSILTAVTFHRNITLRIDLAGNKLTYEADARFQVAKNYIIQVYSSVAGGEFVFGGIKGLQPGSGTFIFGSEEYKNNLTVSSDYEILNPSQVANGSTLRFDFLYCTVNAGATNLIRVNAKGAGSITLEMNIKGCTVNAPSSLVCYNYTTTLGETSNGGVCAVGSYIKATDSSFNCSATDPVGFFGSANFADRYFGTVSFAGCTFRNYVLNGDLIYSDEALSYNTYFDTLAGTGYDPRAAVTVDEGCVFYSYGGTFTEDMTGFAASNVSLREDCKMSVTADCVSIISSSYGCSVEIDGAVSYYPKNTDFKAVLDAVEVSGNSGKVINIALASDMTMSSTATFTSVSGYTLNIDLAGHTLTVAGGGRVAFGGAGFTLRVYSSLEGGELTFSSDDDGFQANNGGTIIFGSEEYKGMLTVNAKKELINVGQLANGARLTVKYLYSTVNSGSLGMLRINAKGAGVVTLEAEITGCTVNGSSRIVCYNSSSNLTATTNGGVYGVDSYIRVTDSILTCTADAPVGFFAGENFADRYFGKVSIIGSTLVNYVLNGDLICSDEALSYNTYFDTLVGGGYDPMAAITVGGGSVFVSYGSTFTERLDGFTAQNTSLANGCIMAYTENSVLILDTAEHTLSEWKSEDGQHWKECESCADGVKLNLADCIMDDSVTPAVCTVCGATAEAPVDPSPEHSYESIITPPTCTERGYTTHTCSHCGDSYVDSYVAALGHSFGDWAVVTAPNCTEDGLRTKECSVCGEKQSEAVDALGHDEVEHAAKAPTCDAVGWNEYISCTRCDYSTYSQIEANGHDFADADCDTPRTCEVCGATEGNALGHDWIDATTEAPKTCDRCGATEGEKLPDDEGNLPGGEGGNDPGADDTPDAPTDDHKDCESNIFLTILNAIINFFRTLFGMPEVCVCGKEI